MGVKWHHIVIFVGVVVAVALLFLPGEREWGVQLQEGGYAARSEEHLRQALAGNPRDEELLRRLSSVYIDTGRPQKAVPLLERLLKLTGNKKAVRRRLIDLHVRAGNDGRAIELLKAAEPTRENRRLLADLYRRTGRVTEAVALVEKLLEERPEDVSLLLRLAHLRRYRMDPAGEAAALRRLAEVRPTPDVLTRLVELALSRQDLALAGWAADALEEHPDVTADGLRLVRSVRLRARKLRPALRTAKRLCGLPEHGPEDLALCAQLQQTAGRKTAALETLRRGAESFPDNLLILRRSAALARELGREEMEAELTAAIAERTGTEPDRVEAARALVQVDCIDEARGLLDELLEERDGLAPYTVWYAATLDLRASARRQAAGRAERLAEMAAGGTDDAVAARLAADVFGRLARRDDRVRMLRAAARAEPRNADVLEDLATACTDAGRPGEALEVLDRLEKLPGADARLVRRERARNHLALARRAAGESAGAQRQKAIEAIEACLQDARHPGLRAALVELYAAQARYGQAHAAMQKLDEAGPEVWLDLAGRFADSDRPRLTREALRHIDDPSGFDAQQLTRLAYAHRKAGEPREAIRLYEEALEKAPGSDRIRRELADAYAAAGERQKEYALMEKLARAGGVQNWLNAADRHRWHDDPQGEARVLAEALERHPGAPELLGRGIRVYADLALWQKALELYGRLRTAGKGADAAAMAAAGRALAASGRLSAAERTFEKALRKDPLQREALVGLADLKAQHQEFRAATRLYRAYLEQKPDDGWVWFRLGEAVYEGGGDGGPAQARALELVPLSEEPATLAMDARIRARRHEWKRSISLYREALSRSAQDPDVACDFVDVLLWAGRAQHAERVLRTAAAGHPRHLRLRRRRAQLMLQNGRYGEAAAILRELHRRHPNDVAVQWDLAVAERMAGRWARSMQNYDAAARRSGFRGGVEK